MYRKIIRKVVCSSVVLVCFVLVLGGMNVGWAEVSNSQPLFDADTELVWVMVNVNSQKQHGDAHLIVERAGKAILIDAGERRQAESNLLPYLQSVGVSKLDAVFITHPHRDHYGGLFPLLRSKAFSIGEIFLGPVSKELCLAEKPGCRLARLQALRQLASERKVPVYDYRQMNVFRFQNGARLEKLFSFTETDSPVQGSSINDLSLISLLRFGKTRVLFTGDLNRPLSAWIVAQHPDLIRADILKFPHHGGESYAESSFIEAVHAAHFLVPSLRWEWCSERCSRTRELAEKLHAQVHVNGIDGHIIVRFKKNGFAISHSYGVPLSCP